MSSVLHGGRKRRRFRVRLAVLVALAVPLATGATVYFTLVHRPHHGSDLPVFSLGDTTGRTQARQELPPLPRAERPPGVRMSGVDAFRLRMRRPPLSALLFDVDNGDVLWRLHPRRRLPIASLTKIMTAVLVTERAGPDERVLITRPAVHTQGSAVGVLPRHKRVRLEALLNGLLIVSGNDAAVALADHISGNEQRFVMLMNRRARQLGLRCPHFVSSYGLQPGNRSCARDLAVLSRLAMRSRRIRRVARRARAELPF